MAEAISLFCPCSKFEIPAAFNPWAPVSFPTTPSARGASKAIRELAEDELIPLDDAMASVTDEALFPKSLPINDCPTLIMLEVMSPPLKSAAGF